MTVISFVALHNPRQLPSNQVRQILKSAGILCEYTDAEKFQNNPDEIISGFIEFIEKSIAASLEEKEIDDIKNLHINIYADINLGLSKKDFNVLQSIIENGILPRLEKKYKVTPKYSIIGAGSGGTPQTEPLKLTCKALEKAITAIPFDLKQFGMGNLQIPMATPVMEYARKYHPRRESKQPPVAEEIKKAKTKRKTTASESSTEEETAPKRAHTDFFAQPKPDDESSPSEPPKPPSPKD